MGSSSSLRVRLTVSVLAIVVVSLLTAAVVGVVGDQAGQFVVFALFDEFFAAFKAQLRHLVDWIIRVNNVADAGRARWEPVPYLSALVDGCLASGIHDLF